MDYNKIWHYDVESFPTFFCVTFMEDSTKEVVQFAIGCGQNQLGELKYFITQNKNNLFVGFNNLSYDNAVMRLIMGSFSDKNIPSRIFALSGKLVSDAGRDDPEVRKYRYVPKWEEDSLPPTMDLFKIMRFDMLGVSLKQVAINLKHERIQDLPLPYDYAVQTEDEVKLIMEYNINDVIITYKLFHSIQKEIKLREDLSKAYHVDLMNASDSKMGNIILAHYYREELGIDERDVKDRRTVREHVLLGECIPPAIQFQTKELQDLRFQIANTVVWHPYYKFDKQLAFRGTRYSLGVGGIHSMEDGCKFEETEDKKIISCDIGSMYPTCIIINDIYPEHLGHDFVKVLSMLTAERLAAKKTDKTKAEGLKITVNGLFGKLNSNTFWLEDAKAMLRVTVAGQLYILMLVEMLELAGIHCISANTDGIECEVRRDMEETYYSICEEWEKNTGFVLEFIEYTKYVKRDVNNYVAVGSKDAWVTKNWRTASRETGKVKTKGAFIPEIDLKKGYKHPIVPRAIVEHFVNGTPVEETIFGCRDIMEFCISQKTGKGFWMELVSMSSPLEETPKLKPAEKRLYLQEHGWTVENKTMWIPPHGSLETSYELGEAFDAAFQKEQRSAKSVKVTRLQKNNRFFISHANTRLQKNNGNKILGMFVGSGVTILNDFDPSLPFDSYDVNLHWYVKEASKIIEQIEPSVYQLGMFGDMTDFGSKSKMEIDESKMTKRREKVKEITPVDVMRAPVEKAVYDVDPKYCVVTKIDTTFSPVVTLYSLAKGTENKVKVPKNIFEQFPLHEKAIILATEFKKQQKTKKEGKNFVPVEGFDWWMLGYERVLDVSKFKRKNR